MKFFVLEGSVVQAEQSRNERASRLPLGAASASNPLQQQQQQQLAKQQPKSLLHPPIPTLSLRGERAVQKKNEFLQELLKKPQTVISKNTSQYPDIDKIVN